MTCKNDYYRIDEQITKLVVTRQNGDQFHFLINTEDMPKLKKYIWHCHRGKYLKTMIDGKQFNAAEILFHPQEPGMVWDHINRNPYDYRKSNLRYVTWQTNLNNKWKPRTDAGDVYGIFKTKYGYRTRAADGSFPTYKNWMDAAKTRLEFLLSRGLKMDESLMMLDFNDLDEFEFVLNLCSNPA